MAFLTREDTEVRICFILALSIFVEQFGVFVKKAEVMETILLGTTGDEDYDEAVARLEKAESVFAARTNPAAPEEEEPEMDITQLFDEEWLQETSNEDQITNKIERIKLVNDVIEAQKINSAGDFDTFAEFIKRELVSGDPDLTKEILKLTTLLKNCFDITVFLPQIIKLCEWTTQSKDSIHSEIEAFLGLFKKETIPYGRIHESMMDILTSKKVSNSIKISAIQIINGYRLGADNYHYKQVKEAIYALE